MFDDYYNRQILLIGKENQKILSNSSIAIVGVGGLGTTVADILTRTGIKNITLIDGDNVKIENIHRQSLFNINDIGTPKVLAAKNYLRKVNPQVNIITQHTFLNENNALELLKNNNVIIDCTDRIITRYIINDASLILNTPMVYAALYKYSFQLSVFNYNGSASYRCLFPEIPDENLIPNCSTTGILPPVVYTAASLQANETIKILLKQKPLYNKLLLANLQKLQFQFFNITPNKNEINKVLKANKILVNSLQTTQPCNTEINLQQAKQIIKSQKTIIFDFRTELEAKHKFQNALFVSPKEFIEKIDNIPKDTTLIFVCFSGIQSKMAHQIAQLKGFKNSYFMKLE